MRNKKRVENTYLVLARFKFRRGKRWLGDGSTLHSYQKKIHSGTTAPSRWGVRAHGTRHNINELMCWLLVSSLDSVKHLILITSTTVFPLRLCHFPLLLRFYSRTFLFCVPLIGLCSLFSGSIYLRAFIKQKTHTSKWHFSHFSLPFNLFRTVEQCDLHSICPIRA